VDICEASRDARTKRRQHADILKQNPGEAVQKKCAPRREMQAVRTQCTDGNGFVRTCTKQVAGDVVGYVCPKTVDPDVAKLGIYQLGLQDNGFPFPEDLRIPMRDEDCDAAAVRLEAIREELGPSSDAGTANSIPAGAAEDTR
jgi:hypothetical protein